MPQPHSYSFSSCCRELFPSSVRCMFHEAGTVPSLSQEAAQSRPWGIITACKRWLQEQQTRRGSNLICKLSMLDTEVPENAELQYPTASHCLQTSEGRNIFNTEVKSARQAARKHLKEKKKHNISPGKGIHTLGIIPACKPDAAHSPKVLGVERNYSPFPFVLIVILLKSPKVLWIHSLPQAYRAGFEPFPIESLSRSIWKNGMRFQLTVRNCSKVSSSERCSMNLHIREISNREEQNPTSALPAVTFTKMT